MKQKLNQIKADYICVDKRKFIFCFLNSYADLERLVL